MRAAHDATYKTDTVQRHEDAPRPTLPESVSEALAYDELGSDEDVTEGVASIDELREQTFYADAAPADPEALNEEADGEHTLDELC